MKISMTYCQLLTIQQSWGYNSPIQHIYLNLFSQINSFRLYDDTTKKGSVIIQGMEEVTVHNKNEVLTFSHLLIFNHFSLFWTWNISKDRISIDELKSKNHYYSNQNLGKQLIYIGHRLHLIFEIFLSSLFYYYLVFHWIKC